MSKNNKFFIGLGFLIISVVVAGMLYINHLNSFQDLQINFAEGASGVSAKVYEAGDGGHEANPEDIAKTSSPIREVSANTSLRLKKGGYVILSSGNKDYAVFSEEVELDNEPKTVLVNPQYTQSKLDSLLSSEISVIHEAIKNNVHNFRSDLFDISRGELFQLGEWYATTINPKKSEEELRTSYNDTFRLIAKKEAGSWKVVTLPPELLIGFKKYPDVPRDIILKVNSMGSSED